MIWMLLFACGSEPDGLSVGPLVLPAAEHASKASTDDWRVFADPTRAPEGAALDRCKAGEAVRHDLAVLEVREDGVRLAGRPIPEDLVPDALTAMSEATRTAADAGCKLSEPGGLLLAVDERASYARVMGLVYVAARAGFTRFDIVVEDATPDTPHAKAGAATQTLLVGPTTWNLSGTDLAPDAVAKALPPEPRDTVVAVGDDVPWRDVIRAHDLLAGKGSRVVYGLGDDLEAAPFATSSREASERRLSGEIAVLPIFVPRSADLGLTPPEPGPFASP
jgi:biopolymer transport protein ExbD